MTVRVNDRVRVGHGRDGEIVVVAAYCGRCKSEAMPVGNGDCPWCGSRILDESLLSARAMLDQLRNGDGASLPTRAIDVPFVDAASGPVEPAPSPEGEPDPAGGGARYRPPVKWTREKVIAAIREVGNRVGGTPAISDMKRAGYASATVSSTTLKRLGVTWPDLVREAGYEPLTRADGGPRRRWAGLAAANGGPREGSGREPQAEVAADAEPSANERTVTPPPAATGEAASRPDLATAIALAARTFADAILGAAA